MDSGCRPPWTTGPLSSRNPTDRIHQVVYVSATPADYELEKGKDALVEQIVRPTGLIDPEIEVRERPAPGG